MGLVIKRTRINICVEVNQHCRTLRVLAGKLALRHGLAAIVYAGHSDAAGDKADQVTQIAADAFLVFVHDGQAFAVHLHERDALVRAVFAGDVAEVALDTFVVINAGDGFVFEVEIAPIRDALGGKSDDVVDAGVTLSSK